MSMDPGKIKTSVSLSPSVLQALDQLATLPAYQGMSRSALIEKIVSKQVALEMKVRRDQRDLEILNEQADEMESEVIEVLDYQVEP
jgi:hypothetical protein